MNQEAWDELYPDGFRSSFSMRHMPKQLHKDLRRLSAELEISMEYALIMCAEHGVKELTQAIFARG